MLRDRDLIYCGFPTEMMNQSVLKTITFPADPNGNKSPEQAGVL